MNATRKQIHLQQGVIKKFVENTETQTFFNLLTGPELFDVIESNLLDHRERRFPPTETLAMFLSQALNTIALVSKWSMIRFYHEQVVDYLGRVPIRGVTVRHARDYDYRQS